MWIKFPENTVRVDPAHLPDAPDEWDDPIEVNENGSANVSEAVGTYLLSAQYDGTVSRYNTE